MTTTEIPLTPDEKLTLNKSILEKLFGHAAAAARIIGHLDDTIAVGPLADHVDAIVHDLSELLGNPHLIAAPVPSTQASRTISITIDDGTRHDLVRLPDPDELGIAFADDETTQPHIALSGGAL
jgi:hypothetical protein